MKIIIEETQQELTYEEFRSLLRAPHSSSALKAHITVVYLDFNKTMTIDEWAQVSSFLSLIYP